MNTPGYFKSVAIASLSFLVYTGGSEAIAQGLYHPHIVFDLNGHASASGTWLTDDPSFLFTPSTSGTATFTHGFSDSAATMKLYNHARDVLLKTESNTDGKNSMDYSVVSGTEYRLWLDMPFTQTQFSISIDLPPPPVTTISLDSQGNASITSTISPSTEGEYWKYVAPATGTVQAIADSVGGIGWDTDLFVFDSGGTRIFSDTGGSDDGNYSAIITSGTILFFLVRGDLNDEGSD